MMTCSLAGRLFASRSIRPVATTYCRFFSLKLQLGRGDESEPEVRDLFKKANSPRLSATTNLARLLNLMDNHIGVTPAVCPRWDVIEDTKALYITRDLSGLPLKDIVEREGIFKWDEYSFGCTYVWPEHDEIRFTVSLEDPRSVFSKYFIKFSKPDTIYRPKEDIVMNVKGDVLKITIPKKKGMWTHNRITIMDAVLVGLA